jgi:excisionase family DNA binding protein
MNVSLNPSLPKVLSPQPTKLLYSVPEAATALSIGQTVLWRYVSSGTLVSVKLGRSRRIRAADLERFVSELAEAI